jgi:anti-sigma factor RsiW
MTNPMIDAGKLDLLHAEIDGELDPQGRAELSRALLAEPETRSVREELRRLCGRLDAIGQVEPPAELVAAVLRALPPASSSPTRIRWSAANWRYAAMLAGVIVAGAAVFRMTDGQLMPAADVAGTLASPRGADVVGSTAIAGAGASGTVSLVRGPSGLQLAVDLSSGAPLDLQVASGEQTLTINGLGAGRSVLALPGFEHTGEAVRLSFRVEGREVARARLGD